MPSVVQQDIVLVHIHVCYFVNSFFLFKIRVLHIHMNENCVLREESDNLNLLLFICFATRYVHVILKGEIKTSDQFVRE